MKRRKPFASQDWEVIREMVLKAAQKLEISAEHVLLRFGWASKRGRWLWNRGKSTYVGIHR